MRSWDIKVTQYGCGNQDLSGLPGCLQYFTGETGDIMSFNLPTGTAVTATGNLQLDKPPMHSTFVKSCKIVF